MDGYRVPTARFLYFTDMKKTKKLSFIQAIVTHIPGWTSSSDVNNEYIVTCETLKRIVDESNTVVEVWNVDFMCYHEVPRATVLNRYTHYKVRVDLPTRSVFVYENLVIKG